MAFQQPQTQAYDPPTSPNELPSPPFYTIPNINNLRDATASLAPTTTGATLRKNILYRSADVSKLTPTGWSTLHSQLGISHIFDLRSKPEIERSMSLTNDGASSEVKDFNDQPWMRECEKAGINRVWVPVFEDADYSPERLAARYVCYMEEGGEGFVKAYEDILKHGGAAYGKICRYLVSLDKAGQEGDVKREGIDRKKENAFLSNNPKAPIPSTDGEKTEKKAALIHCTAGKDRTGIFFGVLFAFLGVPADAIAEEYNLTETGLGHLKEEFIARLSQVQAFREYAKKELGEEGLKDEEKMKEMGRSAALRMIGARKESMIGSLKMVERIWGSAEGYLREVVGFGDGELEALKRVLLVEGGQ